MILIPDFLYFGSQVFLMVSDLTTSMSILIHANVHDQGVHVEKLSVA